MRNRETIRGRVLTSPNNRDSGVPKSSPSLPEGIAMHCQTRRTLRFSEFDLKILDKYMHMLQIQIAGMLNRKAELRTHLPQEFYAPYKAPFRSKFFFGFRLL